MAKGTLDRRGQTVGGMDATLDATTAQAYTNLTINYSSLFPVSGATARSLGDSFLLTRRAIDAAVQQVDAVLGYKHGQFGTVEAIMRYHFRFGALKRKAATDAYTQSVDWGIWQSDLLRLRRLFVELRSYLHGPVTISDSHAPAIAAVLDQARHDYATTPFYGDANWTSRSNADLVATWSANQDAWLAGKKPGMETYTRDNYEAYNSIKPNQTMPKFKRDAYYKYMAMSNADRSREGDTVKDLLQDVMQKHSANKSIHIDINKLCDTTAYTRLYVACVILHEASHKVCYAIDYAYLHEPHYQTFPKAQALINADSIAMAAVCLFKMVNIKTADELRYGLPGSDFNN
jgi:hypothetical protein